MPAISAERHIQTVILLLSEAIISDALSYSADTSPTCDVDRHNANMAKWTARIAELRAVRATLEEIVRLGKLREDGEP